MKHARIFWLVVTVATGALCGCGTNPVWKRQLFDLTVPTDAHVSPSRTNIVSLGHLSISPRFQGRSFVYRTAEDTYERDPYAGFLVSPERALAEPIRARLRNSGAFGHVLDPGGRLVPSVIVEADVSELDGDFRNPSHPLAEMAIHFIIYDVGPDGPGRILIDKTYAGRTPLARRTPADLVAAWDKDLIRIMNETSSDYAKTHPDDR
jgi:hypothetical protein